MSHRILRSASVNCCVCLLIAICLFSAPVLASDMPNILLIVSEDNGPELGCYGDPYARTPNLDRLASQGIRFSRAYVPQSGCSQSRASFLTGLYPHQHGQLGLATWGFRLYDPETPNLPRRLKSRGYRTGLIGKLHINPASAFPFDLHQIPSANFQRKDLAGYARTADAFIRASERPFFLSVNYPEAHDPWIAQIDGLPTRVQQRDEVRVMDYMGVDSPEFREMVADYYNCISRLDSLIGDLLSVLEDSGKADDTLVIYLGDHGADMLRGKRTCYEGGLRIPMLLRWPGRIAPQVRHELVSTLDLMPTVLAVTGTDAPEGLVGENLAALFQSGSVEWRSYFCAEYHTHAAAPNYFPQRCIRGARYKLIESLLPDTVHPDYQNTLDKLHGDYAARRSERTLDLAEVIASSSPTVREAYRLMRRPPRFQLYDLQKDPHEFHDLSQSAEHAPILKRLKHRMDQWRRQTNDPLLDQDKLDALTNEVRRIGKKSVAKKHDWAYPRYFFDR